MFHQLVSPTVKWSHLEEKLNAILPGLKPQVVPIFPIRGWKPGECAGNVNKAIYRHGGSSVAGWTIWLHLASDIPLLLEAEWHIVHKTKHNILLSVQEELHAKRRILFCPDPSLDETNPQRSRVVNIVENAAIDEAMNRWRLRQDIFYNGKAKYTPEEFHLCHTAMLEFSTILYGVGEAIKQNGGESKNN